MMKGACEPDRTERGFTLLEMLVVLAIIALVAAFVPRMISSLPALQLRTAAADMVASLRELHDQAIRQGVATELVLDPATATYVLSTTAIPHRLPDVVDRVEFQTLRVLPAGPQIRVRFFPDGSATGGTLFLGHGDSAAAVTIDWQTGRVTRGG